MNLPQMIPVQSTNVNSVGHDGQNLFVKFNNGSIYTYSGVPASVFQELLNAPSKGKFLHYRIKGVYPDTRIV